MIFNSSDKGRKDFSCPLPYLGRKQVHVFRVDLYGTDNCTGFWHVLSADEKQRATKFISARDRNAFVIVRGSLRMLIAGHLSIAPSKVRILRKPEGKPFLANGRLSFNVSHSENMALIALTKYMEVGIDIEFIDRSVDIDKISRKIFSGSELAYLETMDRPARIAKFYLGWCRKEACLKNVGSGLTDKMAEIEVSPENEISDVISVRPTATTSRMLFLRSLPTIPGFRSALALDQADAEIVFWGFPPLAEARPRYRSDRRISLEKQKQCAEFRQ